MAHYIGASCGSLGGRDRKGIGRVADRYIRTAIGAVKLL